MQTIERGTKKKQVYDLGEYQRSLEKDLEKKSFIIYKVFQIEIRYETRRLVVLELYLA